MVTMDRDQHIIDMLEQRDIKPTAMRILILKAMRNSNEAFSLQNLEDKLDRLTNPPSTVASPCFSLTT